MRVMIMTDMEGVSGICVWDQVLADGAMFQEGRHLYTQEVNAAVRGARLAGAEEIVVVDCHGAGNGYSFNSLIPDDLDIGCQWVAHHPWGRYTELLEKGCDACLLIGMHARAGVPDGVLCHTISVTKWRNLYFNDQCIGEIGINAALCGLYSCPVAAVSGDEAACREAIDLLGDPLKTIAVKRGLTRYSARHTPPAMARKMIEEGCKTALTSKKFAPPYRPAEPCRITIELPTVEVADRFRHREGVTVPEPLIVISEAATWIKAWNQIWD